MFVFTIKCSKIQNRIKLHKIVGIQIKLVHEISSVGTKLFFFFFFFFFLILFLNNWFT